MAKIWDVNLKSDPPLNNCEDSRVHQHKDESEQHDGYIIIINKNMFLIVFISKLLRFILAISHH